MTYYLLLSAYDVVDTEYCISRFIKELIEEEVIVQYHGKKYVPLVDNPSELDEPVVILYDTASVIDAPIDCIYAFGDVDSEAAMAHYNAPMFVVSSIEPPRGVDDIQSALVKKRRDDLVSKITVTISSGKTFDGDEKSQDRMARAVAVGSAGMTVNWKLADNSVAVVTWEELKEALYLAGQAQTEIWV